MIRDRFIPAFGDLKEMLQDKIKEAESDWTIK